MKFKRVVAFGSFLICNIICGCWAAFAQADINWVKSRSVFNCVEIAFLEENMESLRALGWQEGMTDRAVMALLNEPLADEELLNKLLAGEELEKKKNQYNAKGLASQYGLFKQEKNLSEAAEWYQCKECKNNAVSIANLAMIRIEEGDLEDAIELFKKIAENGFGSAQFCLACLYFQTFPEIMPLLSIDKTIHPDPDPDQTSQMDDRPKWKITLANCWLNKAIEKDCLPAKYLKARMLSKCPSVITDDNLRPDNSVQSAEGINVEIRSLINDAADKQFPLACYTRALYQVDGEVFEQSNRLAAEDMVKAADLGCIKAQCDYGKWLIYGDVVEELNENKGVDYLKSASDRGSVEADYELGKHYYFNDDDNKQFLVYMNSAVEKDYALANAFMGLWFCDEKNSTGHYDKKKALKLLERAISQDKQLGLAKSALAVLYIHTYWGIPYLQIKKARRIITLLEGAVLDADASASANVNLARAYFQGDFGLTKNKQEALRYFREAYKLGFEVKRYDDIKLAYDLSREYWPADYDETSLTEVQRLFQGALITWLSNDKALTDRLDALSVVEQTYVEEDNGEEENGESLFIQGIAYEYGFAGQEQSKDKALKYYLQSYQEKKFIPAAYHAALLKIMEGTEDSLQYAEKLVLNIIEDKNYQPLAQYCAAKINFKKAKLLEDNADEVGRLRQTAERYLQTSAEAEFPPAEYSLGCWKLKKEFHDAQSVQAATKLIGLASDHGMAAAQCLSYLLAKRKMMYKKYNRKDLLRKAAKQKYIPAMNAFGEWFLRYPAMPARAIHSRKAIAALKEAADQGDDAAACYNLGKAYQRGAGVNANIKSAVCYYTKAANKGLEIAKAELDKILRYKSANVSKKVVED